MPLPPRRPGPLPAGGAEARTAETTPAPAGGGQDGTEAPTAGLATAPGDAGEPAAAAAGATGVLAAADAGGAEEAGPLASPRPAEARRPGRPALRTEGARRERVQEVAAVTRRAPPAERGFRPGGPADLHPCADPRLVGVHVPTVVSENRACGIADPVRVNAIGGVRLSTAATLDCETARRTALFMQTVVNPLARRVMGSPVEEAWVMGSYVCRTQNHKRSGRISEHGRGRAIDIGGFTLADGRKITIEDHWGKGDAGLFLRQVHRQACGLFKTVLGPGSDGYHEDHLHFDTAQRGGGPHCR